MKNVVDYVTACHGYSERRACALTRQHRSTQRKPSTRDPRTEVRQRMHEIVRDANPLRLSTRPHHAAARRVVGRAQPRLSALSRRRPVFATKRPRRRKMVVHREARCQTQEANEAWSLDFIHDQLSNGKKFRALTVVDVFSREALRSKLGIGCAASTSSTSSIVSSAAWGSQISVCRQWRGVHRSAC